MKKSKKRHPKKRRLRDKKAILRVQSECTTNNKYKPSPPATEFGLLRLLPPFIRRKLEHRSGLQKILENIGWLFIDKILRMGVGLLVGVWVARYLGPEQFGQINYAMAFAGLFGAIAGLGLNGIVVRDIVRDPEVANTTLGTAFVLQLFGGLIAIALIVGTMAWLRPDDTLTKTMVALFGLGLVFKSTEVVKYWFESQVHSRYTVWIENGAFIIMAAVKVAMILQQASLMAFVWITLAESVLVAIGLLVIYDKRGGHLSAWQLRFTRAKSLLRDSWPLILADLAVLIYLRIDQIMLGEMLGAGKVGNYSAAAKISEIWYFIPMVIVSSMSPSIIEAKNHSQQSYHRRLQLLYRLMVLLCLLITIPMMFLSKTLITILYGYDYDEAGLALEILIWTCIPVALGVASSQVLILENLQHYSFYRTFIGCILNILLNLLLIPKFGIIGSAWATLLSYFAATFSLILFPKCRSIIFLMIRSVFLYPQLCNQI